MKKLFAMLFAVLALCAAASYAGYNGQDDGSYRGSKSVHFSVAVTSQTTAAIFAVATYSSSFATLDDMEFTVCGSSPVYISSYTACATGTDAAPNAKSRYLAVGQIYRLHGRNVSSIFGKCEDATTDTAVITGTIWGH